MLARSRHGVGGVGLATSRLNCSDETGLCLEIIKHLPCILTFIFRMTVSKIPCGISQLATCGKRFDYI
jgi:hypothetical protein